MAMTGFLFPHYFVFTYGQLIPPRSPPPPYSTPSLGLGTYQPLSHALQHPLPQPSQYSTFPASNATQPYPVTDTQREEEEEEEEEVVEEELDDNSRRELSPSASPRNKQVGGPAAAGNPSPQEQPAHMPSVGHSSSHGTDTPEQKRRPGRPKGSRNRKPRENSGPAGKSQFPSYPISQGGAPPLPGVTAQNQQYYEFQWRVLNLCSEFYGAAEELIKATPSLIIAQSYQMGPSSKVDPLTMLNEAKRICDQLLQNPSQLVGQPPPSVYAPVSYPPPSQTPASAPATTPQPSAVITNPSTFVMPLGMPSTSQPMYSTMYTTTPPRYPTAPYYQYPHAPGYYSTMPTQSAPVPPTTPTSAPPAAQFIPPAATATTSTLTMATSNPAGASGAWTDEEVDRLKRFAEQSRTSGSSNETDWDWVVGQWGNTRTRHQILLKATALGLKESTTRGVKRRREGEVPTTSEAAPAPAPPTMNALTGAVSSPVQSHTTTSTPSTQPSPAIHNPVPPQPQSATSTPTLTPSRPTTTAPPSNMPWPMPTVAANTSPVIAAAATSSAQSDQRGTSYYRQPRTHPPPPPPPVKAVPSTSHQFMYQPNGKSSK
ncbi:hypothetical protein F5148DRAFT_1322656 [Russula earlei]|uniref:Uncharacterized protein n=1 Tax=Russula earlei TaxID=71964 RepID=A0ACC0U2U2_9AGAM|nr:hypothetical protein F5148DRAFT_1322656 [Russula earlei]